MPLFPFGSSSPEYRLSPLVLYIEKEGVTLQNDSSLFQCSPSSLLLVLYRQQIDQMQVSDYRRAYGVDLGKLYDMMVKFAKVLMK